MGFWVEFAFPALTEGDGTPVKTPAKILEALGAWPGLANPDRGRPCLSPPKLPPKSVTTAALALGVSRRMLAYYRSGAKPVPRTVALACLGWEEVMKNGGGYARAA